MKTSSAFSHRFRSRERILPSNLSGLKSTIDNPWSFFPEAKSRLTQTAYTISPLRQTMPKECVFTCSRKELKSRQRQESGRSEIKTTSSKTQMETRSKSWSIFPMDGRCVRKESFFPTLESLNA